MSENKDPSIFQIAQSLLASFFGVQSQENMDRDEKYIEKNGIKINWIPEGNLSLALKLIKG